MDSKTDLFLSLTPDKVLAAVEAAGLRTNPVCYPLNSFENRVYEVELADRTRIIAKFYRPARWTEEQILEEHRFLEDLYTAEIPVCPVRPFPDGSTLKRQEHIWYTLADRRGGRAPDEVSDPLATRLGRLAGRMHDVALRRPAPSRLTLGAESYIRANLDWLEEHETVPVAFRDRYLGLALDIADILDELMQGVPLQRVHGDLHLGNLLVRDDMLHVLDFDDMAMGPAVQDLWLALPGHDSYTTRQRELFLDGYTQFRPFDRTTLRLIEPLRALRLIHYATWLARRWHDPVFPTTWPHFGTEAYWEEGTADLADQLTRINQDLGRAPGNTAQETEMTNKDFFWDWDGD